MAQPSNTQNPVDSQVPFMPPRYSQALVELESRQAVLAARGIRSKITTKKTFPKLVVDPAHSGMVYLIHNNMGHVKIGLTKNIEQRLATLQTAHPITLGVVRVLAGGRAAESWLHAHYAERRMLGEWFRYCPTMHKVVPPIGGGDWPEGGLPL